MANIKQLRSFLILCEELHFGHAAQRLNIVQPALSTHIKTLEEELGIPLFIRDPKGVSMTKAGDVFREDAIAILNRLDGAIDRVHLIKEGKLGEIHLAGSATALASGVAAPYIRQFAKSSPLVNIRIEEIHPFEQSKALLEGDLDIAFSALQVDEKLLSQLDSRKLTSYPYLMAVSLEHPLAREKSTSIRALATETLITLQSENSVGGFQPIFGTLPHAPSHFLMAASPLTMLSLVDANLGVAIVSSALCKNAGQGIAFLELEDVKEQMEVWMYSRKGESDPIVSQFLDIVSQTDRPES